MPHQSTSPEKGIKIMKNLSSALTAVLALAAPMAIVARPRSTLPPHKLQPNEHALNLAGAIHH